MPRRLAALAAGRIPGDAVTASSGSGRSRALLLSPIQPVTWYANGAIAIGPFAAFFAFDILAAIASMPNRSRTRARAASACVPASASTAMARARVTAVASASGRLVSTRMPVRPSST